VLNKRAFPYLAPPLRLAKPEFMRTILLTSEYSRNLAGMSYSRKAPLLL